MDTVNLKQYFQTCWELKYDTIGKDVNYKFLTYNLGGKRGQRLEIYFQGSSSTTDWLRNFAFAKKPYKDMTITFRVHRGFLAAWKEVEDLVIEKINEKESDGSFRFKQIVIIGYSHGAALASLCHECVNYHRPDAKLLGLGFEAPRIYAGFRVKKELVRRWEHFYVIRNDSDIVTHMPPKIFGYCDVGNELHIGRFMRYGLIDSHRPENIIPTLDKLKE